MHHPWIHSLARGLVFGGWMLPAALARLVPADVAAAAPQAVRMFNIVAGGWAFLALSYGLVLALRMRRGLS